MSDQKGVAANFADDPVLGEDGYPTDVELDRIKGWDGITQADGIALMDYVRARWQYAKIGYWTEIEDRDGSRFYEIHTGGWSGNEDLASALQDSLLGLMALQSYHRGGHYLFMFKAMRSPDGN